MQITVHWKDATRPLHQQANIEHIYEERLLALFDTADNAFKAKEDWHLHGQPPIHKWTTYTRIAHIDATKSLTPTEANTAKFVVRFTDGPAQQ